MGTRYTNTQVAFKRDPRERKATEACHSTTYKKKTKKKTNPERERGKESAGSSNQPLQIRVHLQCVPELAYDQSLLHLI